MTNSPVNVKTVSKEMDGSVMIVMSVEKINRFVVRMLFALIILVHTLVNVMPDLWIVMNTSISVSILMNVEMEIRVMKMLVVSISMAVSPVNVTKVSMVMDIHARA